MTATIPTFNVLKNISLSLLSAKPCMIQQHHHHDLKQAQRSAIMKCLLPLVTTHTLGLSVRDMQTSSFVFIVA
jgi:hypothetical protein